MSAPVLDRPAVAREAAAEFRLLTNVIARAVGSQLERRLATSRTNISPLQWNVLTALINGPHTLTDVAKSLAVEPATLVPVVESLYQRGLLERGKDANDRRRLPLSLTAAGWDMVRASAGVNAADPTVDALAEEADLDGLLNALRRVAGRLVNAPEAIERAGSFARYRSAELSKLSD
jgi:DNA-binding MarR family transcriptional regulator